MCLQFQIFIQYKHAGLVIYWSHLYNGWAIKLIDMGSRLDTSSHPEQVVVIIFN